MWKPRGPIEVRRRRNHRGEWSWWWWCTEHPRTRGFHNYGRRVDRWQARRGLPPLPAVDPRVRALNGAGRHWHDYHSACTCRETHRARVSHQPRGNVHECKQQPESEHGE